MISVFPLNNTFLNIYADRCEFSGVADSTSLMTVNIQNSSLSINHSHTLAEIGAAASSHSHTLGALGAAAASHTHTPASIGAASVSHVHTLANLHAYLIWMGDGAVGRTFTLPFFPSLILCSSLSGSGLVFYPEGGLVGFNGVYAPNFIAFSALALTLSAGANQNGTYYRLDLFRNI